MRLTSLLSAQHVDWAFCDGSLLLLVSEPSSSGTFRHNSIRVQLQASEDDYSCRSSLAKMIEFQPLEDTLVTTIQIYKRRVQL